MGVSALGNYIEWHNLICGVLYPFYSQTTYTDKGPKPDGGRFVAFDHITFYVGNAKQAASYYATRMGFELFGYQGLETGSREFARYVVKQNKVSYMARVARTFNLWKNLVMEKIGNLYLLFTRFRSISYLSLRTNRTAWRLAIIWWSTAMPLKTLHLRWKIWTPLSR